MRRALVLAVLLVPLASPAQATAASDRELVERALAWLAEAPDGPRPPYYVEASAQAGVDPKRWPAPGADVFSRLAAYDSPDGPFYSYTRVAHAAGTAGYDPRDVNGVDFVALVREGFDGTQFGSPAYINDDMWAILALRAAGVPTTDPQIRSAVLVIKTRQLPDGGWSHSIAATRGVTDITGFALAALKAAGVEMSAYASAGTFLDRTYDEASGGHEGGTGIAANCQSTVWALHGYAALGVPERPESLEFLRSLARASGGLARRPSHTAADAFCTAEAIPVLAGARSPFPSFQEASVRASDARAGEPTALGVEPPFTSLTLRWHDERLSGTNLTFPAGGVYAYDWLAEGHGIRARGSATLSVASARPLVGALPASVVVHRPGALVLDLANASDADGAVVAAEVDWGDGNVTSTTRHAYARPGTYDVRVRVRDDAGEWSLPAALRAIVPNRPPEIVAPARVVGDRIAGASFEVRARDPDGDPVVGAGPVVARSEVLGERVVPVVVSDAFGAQAQANVTVEFVNLPPEVRVRAPVDAIAGEVIEIVAEASDPDGPPPSLAWSRGPRAAFEEGEHAVEVVATDADGARTSTRITFLVRAPGEGATRAPEPVIRALDASLEDGRLAVTFDADGYATVLWASDAGDGERRNAQSPLALDLAGASWASVTLEVAGGGAKLARTLRIQTPDEGAPAGTLDVPFAPAPEPVVVHAQPEATPQPPPQPDPAELVQAGSVTSGPPRATPWAAPWLALAAAWLLARRGTRAR